MTGGKTRLIGLLMVVIVLWHPLCSQDARPAITSMIAMVSRDSLERHVRMLSDAGGWKSRMNYTPGNDSARSYIERILAQCNSMVVSRDSFRVTAAQPYDVQGLMNVVGILPGIGVTDEVVVLGAHYDSQAGRDSGWATAWQTMAAPGADDNASGVAGVLEIARVLSANWHDRQSWSSAPVRGALHVVLFGAEEGTTPGVSSYLNGSRQYAQRMMVEGKRVRGFVNLDMIGYNPLNAYGEIVADSQSTWLGNLLRAQNGTYGVNLMIPAAPYAVNRWSDHGPFWDQGYSAALLIESADVVKANAFYPGNPHYHRSSDTAGTINWSLLRAFTQVALATVAELFIDTNAATSVSVLAEGEANSIEAYPNPFNATVTLAFRMADFGFVRLSVHDILGREVVVLVNEEKPAGVSTVRWDATGYATGVYWAVLRDAAGSRVRKILLQK